MRLLKISSAKKQIRKVLEAETQNKLRLTIREGYVLLQRGLDVHRMRESGTCEVHIKTLAFEAKAPS